MEPDSALRMKKKAMTLRPGRCANSACESSECSEACRQRVTMVQQMLRGCVVHWHIVQVIDSMFEGIGMNPEDEISYEEFVEMIDLVDPEMLKKMNIGGYYTLLAALV